MAGCMIRQFDRLATEKQASGPSPIPVSQRRHCAQVEDDLQRLERAAGIRDNVDEDTGRNWDTGVVDDTKSESGVSVMTSNSRIDSSAIAERYRNRGQRAKQTSPLPR